MVLLHLGAVYLVVDGHRQTPWHRLTPPTRILCVLLLLLAIVLTPNGHWWTWAFYGTGILAVILLSQVALGVLLQRLMVEFAFVGVVLLGTLFRGEGTVLWQWGLLKITTTGLMILGSVTLKSLLSLVLLNLLTLTTPIPALLQALSTLKVPPLMVAILASMYRYLGLMVDEFNAMQRAALSRNLISRPRWKRLVVGNMIGSLFIRTYERGERIHQAMLSRGYQGLPPSPAYPSGGRRDRIAFTLTALFALLGQAIYWL